jgi:D-sedoheptulose 7-phosphate isomerase
VTIRVPYEGATAVQERHLPIYHALCAMLEAEFFVER